LNTIATPPIVRTYHVVQPHFDVKYPNVESAVQGQATPAINERLLREMHRLIGPPAGPQEQKDVIGGFEIKSNERNVLSIALIVYTYTGGAHGMTYIKSSTFDVRSGRAYTLAELFKPNSGYEVRLNRIIRAQIAARKLPLLSPFTGIKPDQDFYIADKALVVYFQLYDLTPYAYGLTYFPISVYELEDIVVEDGPLGRMIG